MFNNIGNKVKGLAIFACAIGIIGSLIGAIVLWVSGLIGAGFGALIGGCLCAWIGSWVIYCIGDTNAKVTELKERLDGSKKNTPRHDGFGRGTTPKDSVQKPVEQTAPHTDQTAETVETEPIPKGFVRAIPVEGDQIKCEKCGAVQRAGRSVCWDCGAKLQHDELIWECPSCGRKNKGSNVCWNCGAKLQRDEEE